MKKFIVVRREVWVCAIEVEAETLKDAVNIVKDDGGEVINTEYCDTLGLETWSAEERGLNGELINFYDNLELL